MRKPSVRPIEHKCPACNGTGFPVVTQPAKLSRRIYPIQCEICGGKGRIAGAGN
jgi:DnaJ-class molecular chaperone